MAKNITSRDLIIGIVIAVLISVIGSVIVIKAISGNDALLSPILARRYSF